MSANRASSSVVGGLLLGIGLLCVVAGPTTGRASEDEDRAGGRTESGTRLMLAGDVMLGRGIDQIHARSVDPVLYEPHVRSARDYVALAERASGPIPRDVKPSYIWGVALEAVERLAPALRIVNLETAVTTHHEPWPRKTIQYRAHPANVAILRAGSIDCAVLANNHALDWQRSGLRETLRVLRGETITVAGAGENARAAAAPAVLPVADGRVLVFGAAHGSSGVPEAWAATAERAGVYRLPDLSVETARGIANRVRALRRPGDRVLFSIHWGSNWGYEVPAAERRFARALVDEGAADVVHGHSSHHPKGMEIRGGRLILYGAGDLINDYEGIGGHEQYRPQLALIYLPRLDASGGLVELTLLPFHRERFRLQKASTHEIAWLRKVLARESVGLDFASDGARIVAMPRGD